MQNVTLVGIDLGKHSFHLHAQDWQGKAVFRKKVNRKQLVEFLATLQACTVVMEACAGAHYLARKLGIRLNSFYRSLCDPSSRATRMTSSTPKRSARQHCALPCGL